MKLKDNIRLYTWLEFLLWFILLCVCVFAFRLYKYEKMKELPSYQIFMPDVDGMIVGSPVKYMGVQIGYIKNIKILTDKVYVRFVITEKNVTLPKGVIANVEFSGLGGSKSLELYPPIDEDSDKIIIVPDQRRLNDSLTLINEMFLKIDSIGTRITLFADDMGVISDNKLKIDSSVMENKIINLNEFVDQVSKRRSAFVEKWRGESNE